MPARPGELNGYEGPYHDFNGITSKSGAHFILKIINDKRSKEKEEVTQEEVNVCHEVY